MSEKVRIKIYDREFKHLPCYTGYNLPEYLIWDREGPDTKVTFFTENFTREISHSTAPVKVYWPVEPPSIHADSYNFIQRGGWQGVQHILTFNREILEGIPNGHFWPAGGSWIWKRDWKIYPKTKNISIVAGMKNYAPGHKLRHEILAKLGNKFDLVCGQGRNWIEQKSHIFADYRFSVVVENSKFDWYWTDKLIDAFACGTIPIFWGCPDIGKYFNLDGIYTFNTIDDLERIMVTLADGRGEVLYNAKLSAVQDNFERAKQYEPVEDWLWHNFIKDKI